MIRPIQSQRFWFIWIAASIAVIPLIIILGFIISMVWTTLTAQVLLPSNASYIYPTSFDSSANFQIFQLINLGTWGAVMGLCVGILQKAVINRRLNLNVRGWRRVTLFGGIAGLVLLLFASNGVKSIYDAFYLDIYRLKAQGIFQLIFGVLPFVFLPMMLSIPQALILRRYVRSAWLWVLANAVGGFVFGMLVQGRSTGFADWVLAVVAIGAITGFALLWLLHRLPKQTHDENHLAYVPVPIETDEKPRNPSVWDEID